MSENNTHLHLYGTSTPADCLTRVVVSTEHHHPHSASPIACGTAAALLPYLRWLVTLAGAANSIPKRPHHILVSGHHSSNNSAETALHSHHTILYHINNSQSLDFQETILIAATDIRSSFLNGSRHRSFRLGSVRHGLHIPAVFVSAELVWTLGPLNPRLACWDSDQRSHTRM